MCRQILEGGRRCPCDTSEARRLRKHNLSAKTKFESERIPASPKAVIEPVEVPSLPPLAQIKNLTADIAVIRGLMEKHEYYQDGAREKEDLVLSNGDKISFEDAGTFGFRNRMLAECEKRTITLGAKINDLVSERSGITDEAIAEKDKADREAALEIYNKDMNDAALEHNQIRKEQEEKFGDESKYASAYHNGDPDAKVLYDRVSAYYSRLRTVSHDYSVKLKSINDASEKVMQERVAVQKEVMKELRPLGGDLAVADNSNKKAVTTLKKALEVYPSSWIEASNNITPARIKLTAGRAHYTAGKVQESFSFKPYIRMEAKPKGWEPDPLDQDEAGEWFKANERGEYTNPETGRLHRDAYFNPETEDAWAYNRLEYAVSHYNNNDTKPRGRGWAQREVRDSRTGQIITRWARPYLTKVSNEMQYQPELTVSSVNGEGYRVALHEFAHRVESTKKDNSYITKMEERFIQRRTTDAEGEREKLVRIYPKKKEYARKDNFTNLYMGKEYDGDVGYREILSTGAEAVWGDQIRYGGLIGLKDAQPDPEMKNFILGMWASA
jgi:hypothetical protein